MSSNNHTPAPWCWWGNLKAGDLWLATPNRGRIIIMDHRPGRRPKGELKLGFNVGGVMRQAGEFAEANHNGEFFGLDHPDAKLIADAPNLLAQRNDLCELALAVKTEKQKIVDKVAEAESGLGSVNFKALYNAIDALADAAEVREDL